MQTPQESSSILDDQDNYETDQAQQEQELNLPQVASPGKPVREQLAEELRSRGVEPTPTAIHMAQMYDSLDEMLEDNPALLKA